MVIESIFIWIKLTITLLFQGKLDAKSGNIDSKEFAKTYSFRLEFPDHIPERPRFTIIKVI